MGGSYGGYMVLACLTHFSDRLRCGDRCGRHFQFRHASSRTRRTTAATCAAWNMATSAIPRWRSFSRRSRRSTTSAKITRPLFVVQGKNDPRVPVTEAEQMVKALRERGGTCWYLMATDEGHGFAKKKNADFQFLAQILFLREHLLK